jgi:hypothetical protein
MSAGELVDYDPSYGLDEIGPIDPLEGDDR